MTLIGETKPGPAAGDLIKDGSDAGFMVDVVEASRTQPVIVDFWATWCGPCRQLTPALEKAVLAARGAVKLVKIDIDKHPAIAGQLRVQSVPAVFAFAGGQPVDAFMGALPDSQIKAFIDKLIGGVPASEVDELLAMAKESLDLNDLGGAAQAFAQVLQLEPANLAGLGGLARCYLAGGDAERAAEVIAMAPPEAHNPDLDSVRAALALAAAAPSDTAEAEARLVADPLDHAARLEMALALAAKGKLQEAADHLLTVLSHDRDWNEGAARAELLKVFEAAGPMSDVARQGRKRLSAILFA